MQFILSYVLHQIVKIVKRQCLYPFYITNLQLFQFHILGATPVTSLEVWSWEYYRIYLLNHWHRFTCISPCKSMSLTSRPTSFIQSCDTKESVSWPAVTFYMYIFGHSKLHLHVLFSIDIIVELQTLHNEPCLNLLNSLPYLTLDKCKRYQ